MNEPTPERQVYVPPENYTEIVEDLIDAIFELPAPISDERLGLPDSARYRTWSRGDRYFLAIRFTDRRYSGQDGIAAAILGARFSLVSMTPVAEGLVETKTYQYSRFRGQLHVVSNLFTPEEIAGSPHFPAATARREEMEEGLETHAFTAASVDYTDFLADLETIQGLTLGGYPV